MPVVSIIKNDRELSSTYGKEKLPASFKEMERRGIKIMSYCTTEDISTRRITWLVGRDTLMDCYKVEVIRVVRL
jgi:hypothetical protein